MLLSRANVAPEMYRLDGAGERKGEKQDLWKPILLDPKVKIENVTSYS